MLGGPPVPNFVVVEVSWYSFMPVAYGILRYSIYKHNSKIIFKETSTSSHRTMEKTIYTVIITIEKQHTFAKYEANSHCIPVLCLPPLQEPNSVSSPGLPNELDKLNVVPENGKLPSSQAFPMYWSSLLSVIGRYKSCIETSRLHASRRSPQQSTLSHPVSSPSHTCNMSQRRIHLSLVVVGQTFPL